MTSKIAGFATFTTFFGTVVAAIAPTDFVVWSGGLATIGLGVIALYQKFRDTRRAADLADIQALSDTWKAKYERAHQESLDWQQRAEQAQTGSNEWQNLFKELRAKQFAKLSEPPSNIGSGG